MLPLVLSINKFYKNTIILCALEFFNYMKYLINIIRDIVRDYLEREGSVKKSEKTQRLTVRGGGGMKSGSGWSG